MGVAELEVPAPGKGRGDHLRPLDPDPEAAARRRSPHRDRRVEGGRPHCRWSHVRGGGGRSQRAAQGSGRPDPAGPTSPSRPSRQRRPGRSGVAEAPRSAVARHGKAARARTIPGRSCAHSDCREDEHRQAAPAPAPTGRRLIRPRCLFGSRPGSRPRCQPGSAACAGHRACFGPAHRRPQPRDEEAPPNLDRRFQGLDVLDDPPGQLRRGRGPARDAHLFRPLQPGEV